MRKPHVALTILVNMSFFAGIALTAGESLRTIPLEVDKVTGCHIDNGKIKLLSELPCQAGDNPLVLEAENANKLFFQEDVFARKSGAKVNELIQIKRKASEYTPQKDPGASGGGYIDYCEHAAYQFQLTTSGIYHVWVRHWVPVKGNWNYHLGVDGEMRGISLEKSIPAAKEWFWVKAFSKRLEAGNHSLRVSELRNGKRLDEIVLTLNGKFNPKTESLPASKLTKLPQGEVLFKNLSPVGLKKWKSLKFSGGGGCEFSVSIDTGKSWRPLPSKTNLEKLSIPQGKSILVKLTMKRTKITEPEISNIKALYSFNERSFISLENKQTRILFSRITGGVTGIVNKITGTEVQPLGIENPMFELLLKEPEKRTKRWIGQSDAVLLSAKAINSKKAVFTWGLEKSTIKVLFEVSLNDSELSKWDITIVNDNDKFDVIEVIAPKLSGLRIGNSPDKETLAWPFSAGEFLSFPAARGELSASYPSHAGLGYVDLFNKKEGFYLGCHDPFLVATQFVSKANAGQNAIELSVNRKHRIKTGTKRTYHFALAPHVGDWHKGAGFYRDFFYSQYPVNKYSPWLRRADAWLTGGSIGHGGRNKHDKTYKLMIGDYKRASFLSLPYIQAWGSIFNGACPTFYLPRLDKGGETLFKKMIKIWRDAGGEIGYYFHGNSVSPYYLLSKKYFTVPFSKYPEDRRPPTWDWFVKNKEYLSSSAVVDKKKYLAATAKLNVMHANKVDRKHGNTEESMTGYMPMSWRTKAFPNYLEKWVGIYVKEYKCSTAYLDTFAFRNERANFNPFLKLNGEGDKPMYKMAFLKRFMKEMRKSEPGFCALTEGVGDVFGTSLYFLLSGFARDPRIFRYTLPDQIFFQGSCNAQWTKPLTRKNITQAFMVGNRFDLGPIFPHTYYMLRLRQRVSPFLNYAVFKDDEGITLSDTSLEAYAHVTMPSTDKYIANSGTKSVALTIANTQLVDALLTYKLPDGFNPKYGYACEINREPREQEFTESDGIVSLKAPRAEISCVILVESLKNEHLWTATIQQTSKKNVEVRIFNYSKEPAIFKIDASYAKGGVVSPAKTATIPGGALLTFPLLDNTGNNDFKLVNVSITSGKRTAKYIASLGNSGRTIPKLKNYVPPAIITPKKVDKPKGGTYLLSLDYEAEKYSTHKPYKGERCLELKGNGKYKMLKTPLNLEKNTTYRLSLAQRKGFEVSPVGHHHNVVIANYDKNRKLKIYLNLTLEARDGKWHTLAGIFKTDDDLENCGLYFYNKNTSDSVWIDDVILEKLEK